MRCENGQQEVSTNILGDEEVLKNLYSTTFYIILYTYT